MKFLKQAAIVLSLAAVAALAHASSESARDACPSQDVLLVHEQAQPLPSIVEADSANAVDEPLGLAAATGSISGRVLSGASNHPPMSGVRVELRRGPYSTLVATRFTDARGYFFFGSVPAGASYEVRATSGSRRARWFLYLSAGQSLFQTMILSR